VTTKILNLLVLIGQLIRPNTIHVVSGREYLIELNFATYIFYQLSMLVVGITMITMITMITTCLKLIIIAQT
jgi:hypothetical protein